MTLYVNIMRKGNLILFTIIITIIIYLLKRISAHAGAAATAIVSWKSEQSKCIPSIWSTYVTFFPVFCFLYTHTASLYKFKLLAWRVESSWVESKGGHHKTIFTRGRAFNSRRQRPRLTTWKAKESNASQPILWPISFVKWQVNVSNACKEHETLKCH